MEERLFIRACILYEFDLGHSSAETLRNIRKVYGDDALSDSTVRKWFSRFNKGERNLEDRIHLSRSEILNENKLLEVIDNNSFLTIRELAEIFNCSHKKIENYIREIGKVNKRGRWLPNELSQINKQTRVNVCSSLLSQLKRAGSNKFWDSILISDEKWIVYDNTSKRSQSLESERSSIRMRKTNKSYKKLLVCVWWNTRGLVHFEILQNVQTINSELNCQQLDRVSRALNFKGIKNKDIRFLSDNSTPVSSMVQEKLEEFNWEALPHAPFSPDLSPSDYHLFRSMEHFLQDNNFIDIDQVRTWINEYFNSKSQYFFNNGIRELRNRWREVIDHNGEYCFD